MKKIENNSKELKSSLMNKALSYLSKFSTTESKLRSNLSSYSEKFFSEIRKEFLQNEINSVLKRCKELGYINDETYAKNKIEKFINTGKSKKYIIVKLQSYGIRGEIIENSLKKYFDKSISCIESLEILFLTLFLEPGKNEALTLQAFLPRRKSRLAGCI